MCLPAALTSVTASGELITQCLKPADTAATDFYKLLQLTPMMADGPFVWTKNTGELYSQEVV